MRHVTSTPRWNLWRRAEKLASELVFTDFLSLYRFESAWMIVAKTFHDHR